MSHRHFIPHCNVLLAGLTGLVLFTGAAQAQTNVPAVGAVPAVPSLLRPGSTDVRRPGGGVLPQYTPPFSPDYNPGNPGNDYTSPAQTLGVFGFAGFNGYSIARVTPYSPAAYAGLEPGDAIVFANNLGVRSTWDLDNAVRSSLRYNNGRLNLGVRNVRTGGLNNVTVWLNQMYPQPPYNPTPYTPPLYGSTTPTQFGSSNLLTR